MKAVAEAPGKVIITGEHFVVHGAWALAAAIPRRVRVEVKESRAFSVVSDNFGSSNLALRPVGDVVEVMAREFAFLPRVKVSIKSSIPKGAGLGSSAATMVAVASAISRLRSLRLGVAEIASFSMVGEERIHGHPSGIDSAVCARGGVLLFRPGSGPRRIRFQGKRHLIVSHSGKSRSTRHQINRVATVKERFPSFFEGLAWSASGISRMAADCVVSNDMSKLGGLMSYSQAVLSTLGVSNKALDDVVKASLSLGSYGAKLTGGGGGGCVLSVAPRRKEKSVMTGLSARGYQTFRASVPVEGVRSWLEP